MWYIPYVLIFKGVLLVRIYIDKIDRDIDVSVTYEKTRKYTIKVTPELNVKVIAPIGTKANELQVVLEDAKPWIAKKIEKFENAVILGLDKPLTNGSCVYILGEPKIVRLEKGPNDVNFQGDKIVISTEDKNDIEEVFEQWFKQQAEITFWNMIVDQSDFFFKWRVHFPKMSVKKMHTRWGSCNKRLNKVNLNLYLYSLPVKCIEYVIMHEIVHLVQANHQQDFYNLLTENMPDWKSRKKLMEENFLLCRKS